jgi:hypothetical protein
MTEKPQGVFYSMGAMLWFPGVEASLSAAFRSQTLKVNGGRAP